MAEGASNLVTPPKAPTGAVAVIPARGGSVRIPRKNLREFVGRPMIAYAIEAAKSAGVFDRIIVTTDSAEIAEIATAWGADVPFTRPLALANNHATTVDVLLHADQWLRDNDRDYPLLCCIYPTVPLMDFRYINDGFALLADERVNGAMSVLRADVQPQRALAITEDETIEMFFPEHELARSQDLRVAYTDAGQFYWIRTRILRESRSLFRAGLSPIVLSSMASHDINTPEDWRLAELKYSQLGTAIMRARERAVNFPARSSHVVLGTAQLGLDYGIANSLGRPPQDTANRILESAYLGGIRIFDTAQAYGGSEALLGAFFAENSGLRDWRVVTKISPNLDATNPQTIRAAVESSIRTIGLSSIWTLLLHREKQLDLWDQVLGQTLVALKQEGLIENLGVSVYSPAYTLAALQHSDIDVVEFPANVFDRRAYRAGAHRLELANRKTVLVRSVFLQGLIGMEDGAVPASIPRAREAVSTLRRFCQGRNMSVYQFAYDYVRVRHPNALILLGADSPQQAAENARLADRKLISTALADEWDSTWPDDVPGLIDPASWRLPARVQIKRHFVRMLRKLLPL